MFSLMCRQLRGRAGQWEQVRTMAGIEVVAPIAMIGHATSLVPVEFDVAGGVDREGLLLGGLAGAGLGLLATALLRRLPIARLLAEE